jgi:hypothetical protein
VLIGCGRSAFSKVTRSTTNLNKNTHSNIYFPLQDYPWGGQVPLPSRSGVRVHRTWSAGRRGYEGAESLLQVSRRRTCPGEASFHYLGALHERSVCRVRLGLPQPIIGIAEADHGVDADPAAEGRPSTARYPVRV